MKSLMLALLLWLGAAPASADVSVRWLGVAGFTLTSGETTIAHDPYLSRPGRLRTFFRSYVSDETVLRLVKLLAELPDEDVLALVTSVSRLSPPAARRATKLMSGVVRTVGR